MRHWTILAVFCAIFAIPSLAAAKGPEVDLVDNKLSINADTISLSRLLRLVDLATGMKSKVPPELANRNISVRFSGLNMADGVRKIFQGQPIDYVLVEGQGVIVTASSQSINGTESVPLYNAPPQQPEQPFVQDFQQQQQQPPLIQTPFGPVANPRAGQPLQPGIQPNPALSAPGQQNTLFPGTVPQNPTQPVGIQPSTTPFGTASPFGAPQGTANPFGTQPQQPQNVPANNNNLFGNPFGTTNTLQRTP